MIGWKIFAFISTIPTLALSTVITLPARANTTTSINITCNQQSGIPTIITTVANPERSHTTPMLTFLPEYFSPEAASGNCKTTASALQKIYDNQKMNYLASDTINEKPVVCAVERRGLGCDSYSSQLLFSLEKAISPTKVLYDMLGSDFKGSELSSSRTVSRIYTDLSPSWWWPFSR
jgi:hypothetical protein